MKTMLDDLWLFTEVARIGSLSAAADELHIPTATISRRIRGLETELGITLLQRRARGLATTEEGREFIERCGPHLSHSLSEMTELLNEQGRPKGTLRIAAPVSLAQRTIVPWGMDFMEVYPEIDLEFELGQEQFGNRAGQRTCDLEISVAPLLDTNRKAKRLISTDYVLVASEAYLARKGQPGHPDEFAYHDRIICLPDRTWKLTNYSGEVAIARGKSRLATNVHEIACEAARRGHGIANVGKLAVEADLKAGRLIRLLPTWSLERSDIYLVFSGDGPVSTRLRTFIDYISERARGLSL